MPQRLARTILLLVITTGAAWSTYAYYGLNRKDLTTSAVSLDYAETHPVVVLAFGAFAFAVIRDAFPAVPWGWLFVVVGAGVGMGHVLWPQ